MNVYWMIIVCLAIVCGTVVALSWIGARNPDPDPESMKTLSQDKAAELRKNPTLN